MTVTAIEVDGSCGVGQAKYRCCDNRVQPSLSCEFSNCTSKDAVNKCPRSGKLFKYFNSTI